jgi:hypothetical protein
MNNRRSYVATLHVLGKCWVVITSTDLVMSTFHIVLAAYHLFLIIMVCQRKNRPRDLV